MRKRQKIGKLTNHGTDLQPHEKLTIDFLLRQGFDIEIPLATYAFKRPNADLIMWGLIWEMKSPVVNTVKSITRLFYRGAVQSPHLIFDLRRLGGSDHTAQATLQKLFQSSRKVRSLLIITQAEEILKFKKA